MVQEQLVKYLFRQKFIYENLLNTRIQVLYYKVPRLQVPEIIYEVKCQCIVSPF